MLRWVPVLVERPCSSSLQGPTPSWREWIMSFLTMSRRWYSPVCPIDSFSSLNLGQGARRLLVAFKKFSRLLRCRRLNRLAHRETTFLYWPPYGAPYLDCPHQRL